jgi:uncharacterized protein YkwD
MSGEIVDPKTWRSTRGYLIAQLLIVLLVTSCAANPARSSPTPPAPPAFPVITPIMPQQDPSPTVEHAPTTTMAAAQPTPVSENGTTHTVQPGDTLLGLAKQYGVPMAAIQLENGMGESTVVQADQTLTIPPQEEWEGSSPFWIVHEVKPNETLIGISRAYDLEIDRLQAVNGLDDADRITVGQRLILPLGGPSAAPRLEPTNTVPPTALPQPTETLLPTSTPSPKTATSVASSEEPTRGPEALPPPDLAAWPEKIARLINEVREEHGLPPYAYNETLEQAAQAHANDCAQRGWCSHTGSGGEDIKTRIVQAGYEPNGWAECWAQTQTPEMAVEIWMDETPPNDPHRRTLLSDWFSEVGLGVSEADWGTYIIADFGRP